MQTLEERNICTPANAPLVHSNCDPSLNREETLSVAGLKTSSNNSEVDLLQKERQEQIRRNNRSIQTNRKGYKPSIRRTRYKFNLEIW